MKDVGYKNDLTDNIIFVYSLFLNMYIISVVDVNFCNVCFRHYVSSRQLNGFPGPVRCVKKDNIFLNEINGVYTSILISVTTLVLIIFFFKDSM